MSTDIRQILPTDDYQAIIAANTGPNPPSVSNPFATQDDISGAVDKNFVHNQAAPLAVWNVNHGLNKFCSVTVVDSSNREVVGDIEYIDANNVQITFSSPVVGKAYFN